MMKWGKGRKTKARHAEFLARLLATLQDGQMHRTDDLAVELGVVQRTVCRAIAELRDMGYKIGGSPGKGGGMMLKMPINKKAPPEEPAMDGIMEVHLAMKGAGLI